ncbi:MULTISPECIES: class I SAM-dependent methyltransferase [Blastomonas]|jgi:2-polyprenyl-3-methyl-5-hydroxy-6-metoxy-1,4-benzoquinol methylase|uniref:class I SAM-dependent methyltransferase n=2 Tax=Sphingomonadaceae TaxID=41297 RepID=UPI0009E909C2|nr:MULTISPECIES: class I SAM-dependent methyltransferase [Blastomonas]MDM7966151.1 class I SAM-dependent methyltransferase [Blastomonas fulva]
MTQETALDPSRMDYHKHIREEIIPLVPNGGGTLLDVGGGVGATAVRLKQLGKADRVGVIDLIDATAEGVHKDFSYSGNIEEPAFLDSVLQAEGPFQTILCLDVLEHLVDPWKIVARLHKALVPGGVIVASVPNVRHYSAFLPLAFQNRWDLADDGILDRTHLRFFVRSTAIELMTSSGLKLEEIRGNAPGGTKVKLARALSLGALNSFTNLQYLIRVRRTD